MQLTDLGIVALQEKLQSKEISSVELTRAYLDRIAATDKNINAYITVCENEALTSAAEADKQIASGDIAPLTGIPIALKDIFLVEGIRTTCASKILDNFVAPYDATSVAKLKNMIFPLMNFSSSFACHGLTWEVRE